MTDHHGKLVYASSAMLALACIIYIITGIISLNCLADKNTQCAQTSGFTALVFGCLAACALAVIMFGGKE